MEDQIKIITDLVIGVACAGIDYGSGQNGALQRLHEAEDAVEDALRDLLQKRPPSPAELNTMDCQGGQ